MVKFNEDTNFKSERINSNIPSSSSLPSSDKEIEVQVNPYQDRKYSSNVQYQQKIGSTEFIPHVAEEDMKIIKEKLLVIKGSTHPGE
jgi:hypothetical protein